MNLFQEDVLTDEIATQPDFINKLQADEDNAALAKQFGQMGRLLDTAISGVFSLAVQIQIALYYICDNEEDRDIPKCEQ